MIAESSLIVAVAIVHFFGMEDPSTCPGSECRIAHVSAIVLNVCTPANVNAMV